MGGRGRLRARRRRSRFPSSSRSIRARSSARAAAPHSPALFARVFGSVVRRRCRRGHHRSLRRERRRLHLRASRFRASSRARHDNARRANRPRPRL